MKIFYKPGQIKADIMDTDKEAARVKKEVRTIVYDDRLRIEAYRFEGIVQPFPSHFHEYYVIGFMEEGERTLSCKDQMYSVKKGDILLFNPGDVHACIQSDEGTLDYRGLNISKEVLAELTEEITDIHKLPVFSDNVIVDEEIACCLRALHEQVMKGSCGFGKEEYLLLLISSLLQNYGDPVTGSVPECREEIEKACRFMEQHYSERIYLEQICHHVGLSRSTLLRAFARSKGVTPYNYLENIRISEARKLLEQGMLPAWAALETGFSDQSHFTHCFHRFIGLTPGVYREIFLGREKGETTT